MTRFGTLVRRIDERGRGVHLPLMSVSQTLGVLRRSELTGNPQRAETLDEYKICRAADIVFNKMSIRDGAMGVAPEDGLVTYHYEVMRPQSGADPRYVVYLMKSDWFTGELIKRERGIGAGGTSGVRTTEVPFSVLRTIDAPIPDSTTQAAIANYLDVETSRIDRIVKARRRQLALLEERTLSSIWRAVTKGLRNADVQPVREGWIAEMPKHWGLPAVGANFEVQLGKMLNPEATQSAEQFAYLRNTNVQWDRIELVDLNRMHFDVQDRARYRLEPGDVLVCEGGEVGRAAIWRGEVLDCYYQKALHRVRPRRGASNRFLLYVMWAAATRGTFATEGNTSTIVHLTAEKLRATRIPWPPPREQDEIVDELDQLRSAADRAVSALQKQIELLLERRQALITATVTRQLDIPGVAA